MSKRVIRTIWSLLVILGLAGLGPAATVTAQEADAACEEVYTVQADDWLSKIAEARYGDVTAYPAIVDATNAQPAAEEFATIDNPDLIEIGWKLCLPDQAEGQAMVEQPGQMEQTEQTELTAPEGQMLMVIRNQSKANAPSTFTISGGEYGGGEQLTVDSGERMALDLEPGDYRVIWTTPAADDITFGRDFTAGPGMVATARIIPEKEQAFFNFDVNQEQTPEAQAQQMAKPEEQLTAPENEMLLVVNNFSKANAPSTFTISGGEYAGGEQLTIDAGEEVVLRLMEGDYRVIWTSPAADDITFGREFTAVPGTIARARITPEEEQVAFRFKTGQDETAAEAQPEQAEAAETGAAREFPFEAPTGQGLLVVGNRTLANVPSTLTLTGGRFGGGTEITVDAGEEIFLPVEPGELTVQWSAPVVDDPGTEADQSVIVSRQVEFSAGETIFWWIVPEEFRAFSQAEGEAPVELAQ